ncbi:hypothetical protein [Pararhizobium sp. DWP1-1-3]|uniref:hypothetical protein n=1 Tax=Pararhizobium sp. DWP1-1-3 TaxID=2804652 RepID=UPI003CF622D7
MHFFVDQDSGASISGWVVPDNPSDIPEFVVRVPGMQDINLTANVLRTDLRDLGLHATGMAGFHIDEQHVRDLSTIVDITIFEARSGVPIYRRFDAGRHLEKKLFIMDVCILPQIRILRRLMPFFALSYPVIDRLPIETIGSLIANKAASSIFVSGQPNWMRHGSVVLEKEYVTAALLRDPFEDLAEKLLFIAHLARRPERKTLNLSLDKYETVIDPVAEMDFADRKSVLTGFRKMSPECRRLFRSPMTSVFGGSAESELQRRNVSVALDNLAQFNVVGVRPLYADFASMLDAQIEANILRDSNLETLPGTAELTIVLKELGLVADLLDEDIALFSFSYEAVEAGLSKTSEREGISRPGRAADNG